MHGRRVAKQSASGLQVVNASKHVSDTQCRSYFNDDKSHFQTIAVTLRVAVASKMQFTRR